MVFSEILNFINTYILGPALPVIIFAAGIYFIIKLKGFIFLHPFKIIKTYFTKDSDNGISPFRAATLALAGTLGVGNIVGVASAISMGGPGALFWMWISSAASMFIKYAETTLAILYRKKIGETFHGGAFYYIKNKILGIIFALLCITASFSLGNLIQVKALTDSAVSLFSIPPWIIAVVVFSFCIGVTIGGVKRISSITVALIPFLTIIYIVISFYIIAINIDKFPQIMSLILKDAFNFKNAAAGTLSFMISKSMRYGVSRGLISNEAGCGTAPIAHAVSITKSPVKQGFWGIYEVICDTLILCSLTGFCVLFAYGSPVHDKSNGMIYVLRSYEMYAGKIAYYIIGLSVCLFAAATLICWVHYGLECINFLIYKFNFKTKKTINNIYLVLYSITAAAGVIINVQLAWSLAEISVGVMTIINTIYICFLGDEVSCETKKYFANNRKSINKTNEIKVHSIGIIKQQN